MIKPSVFLFFAVTLCGCTSSSENLEYYFLHSPNYQAPDTQTEARKKVHLQTLQLPEYLKQRSLAIQTGPTTVFFSPAHLWAEPLSNGLEQALNESLWDTGRVMSLPSSLASPNSNIQSLNIKVDDFIATFDGKVLLKGQYWFNTSNGTPEMFYFDYRRPLNRDGFEHAVDQMRKLVGMLANDIAGHL